MSKQEKTPIPQSIKNGSREMLIEKNLPTSTVNIPMPSVKPPKGDSSQASEGSAGQMPSVNPPKGNSSQASEGSAGQSRGKNQSAGQNQAD